jgi:serine/threonine protein kinase
MWFDWSKRAVKLSGAHTRFDYFQIDNMDYQAIPLDVGDPTKGIGINSSVFRAVRTDAPDGDELILKVSNFADSSSGKTPDARKARFTREVKAMRLSLHHGKHNLVINLLGEGKVRVSRTHSTEWHHCILMEAARETLADYLETQVELSFQQKLLLCAELIRSVRALHDIGVYHRDIKPENILRCDTGWKIGDLGLVQHREDDIANEGREQIGPVRWMSPEAFNKAHCIRRSDNAFIDETTDDRSDVYQIGKVCWYVIQGDIPNGCLKSADLEVGDSNLFGSFLKPMLVYRRSDRPTLMEVENRLTPFLRQHAV